MKNKLFIIVAASLAMLTAMPEEAAAQGFLNKIKQKAENAVLNAIGLTGGEEQQKEQETVSEDKTDAEVQRQPSATDRIPNMRQSRVVWDGEVKPSSAADH